MNKYIFPIYRILVPKPVRTCILRKSLRKNIINYFASLPENEVNDDQREVLSYLINNEIRIFPYPFHDNYSKDKIEVFFDSETGMRYVLQDGKRLFFKKRWGINRIKKAYSDLLREQDNYSPHRYLTDSFSVGKDDIVADIGVAEGNFSLSIIEKVKKIYLFEYDREWAESLKATFAPWPDKVEIINKYVSNINDNSHIRFDTFLEGKGNVNFLKIDVDGAEAVVLDSCNAAFKSGESFKIALCTYHKNDDEKDFTLMLKNNGFTVNPSRGYMINYYDKKLRAPYLRRGLIRATR